jgi:spore germination cell wall hydrolase CwlJ-like protein
VDGGSPRGKLAPGTDMHAVMNGLVASTEYSFIVYAVNRFGASQPSEMSRMFKVHDLTDDCKVAATHASSLVLRHSVPSLHTATHASSLVLRHSTQYLHSTHSLPPSRVSIPHPRRVCVCTRLYQ